MVTFDLLWFVGYCGLATLGFGVVGWFLDVRYRLLVCCGWFWIWMLILVWFGGVLLSVWVSWCVCWWFLVFARVGLFGGG